MVDGGVLMVDWNFELIGSDPLPEIRSNFFMILTHTNMPRHAWESCRINAKYNAFDKVVQIEKRLTDSLSHRQSQQLPNFFMILTHTNLPRRGLAICKNPAESL